MTSNEARQTAERIQSELKLELGSAAFFRIVDIIDEEYGGLTNELIEAKDDRDTFEKELEAELDRDHGDES